MPDKASLAHRFVSSHTACEGGVPWPSPQPPQVSRSEPRSRLPAPRDQHQASAFGREIAISSRAIHQKTIRLLGSLVSKDAQPASHTASSDKICGGGYHGGPRRCRDLSRVHVCLHRAQGSNSGMEIAVLSRAIHHLRLPAAGVTREQGRTTSLAHRFVAHKM
jgi:hypothetical protein